MKILLLLLLVLSVLLFVASVALFIKLSRKKEIGRNALKNNTFTETSDSGLLQLDLERRPKDNIFTKWSLRIEKMKGLSSVYRYRKEINLSDFDYSTDNILENDS